jgi:serine phosphatase RsbU (regulator of sigma subunit)
MTKPSLTGTDSFRFRIQRSETMRAALMCGAYAAMILLTLMRRFAGGVVMHDNKAFAPYIGVLAVAFAYEVFVLFALRTASRQNRLVLGWRLTANAVFELVVPALLLGTMHFWSPRGSYAALSGPAVLLFPITILASVLRLRPRTTLCLGIGAAIFHAILAVDTVRVEGLDDSQYPVLLSYAALLAMMGVTGMLVSSAARRYVAEAVEEAEERERASTRLAGIERDLEVARSIQAGLLPSKPPRFAGFDFAGMNKPADLTGGDYYDWQELPNGRLLVVMADVTGHGIGPALVMAICRAYARASAPLDPNPTSLMARLNDLLHPDMSDGRFITLAMAVLDPTGEIELVSAGHGPSLLYRASQRSVERFGGDGLPLAIVAAENYGPSRRFVMERDDVLVMLTDGMFEWKNQADTQFGINRLADALVQAAGEQATQIVDHLYRAVLTFADGASQTDDVTIVAIKRR